MKTLEHFSALSALSVLVRKRSEAALTALTDCKSVQLVQPIVPTKQFSFCNPPANSFYSWQSKVLRAAARAALAAAVQLTARSARCKQGSAVQGAVQTGLLTSQPLAYRATKPDLPADIKSEGKPVIDVMSHVVSRAHASQLYLAELAA